MTDWRSPYRVWLTATIVVRISQLIVLASFLWGMAALIDAIDPPSTIGLPPFWPFIIAAAIGAQHGAGAWQRRTVGGKIASHLAPRWCLSCGHDIFDPTPPRGYHTPTDREAFLPSRICANCGYELTKRSVAA